VPPVASISTFGSEVLWCDAADEEYVTFKNSVVGTSRACRVGAAVENAARQRLLVRARRERIVTWCGVGKKCGWAQLMRDGDWKIGDCEKGEKIREREDDLIVYAVCSSS